ncbi:AraJ Arabinose efflux permease [Burkholderiales bacterium]
MVNPKDLSPHRSLTWALAALFMGYAITFSGRQLMAVAVEPLRLDFGLSDTQMGLVNGPFFALAFALTALPMGQLASQINRRVLIAAGLMAWGMVAMGIALAHGLWVLLLARLVHAVLEAGLTPASMSLVTDLAPPHRQAAAMGVLTTAPTLSAVASLALGGVLIGSLGWRPVFWGVAVLATCAGVVCWMVLRDRPHQGFPQVGRVISLTLQSMGVLMATSQFRWLALAAGLNTLGGYSLAMWNAAFLVRTHGYSLADAGLISGLGFGLPSALGMMVGATLSDRLRASSQGWSFGVSCWGIGLGFVTALAYFLWPAGLGPEWGGRVWPLGLLFGALSAFFSVWWTAETFSTAARTGDDRTRPLSLAALSSISTLIGIGVGPVLVGMVSDQLAAIGLTETLGPALAISALFPLLSILAFLQLKPQTSGAPA